MYSQSRRRFMATFIVITGVMAIFLYNALAADLCSVQHPLKPADKAFSGRCNNCSMARAMWARTWKEFENSKGRFEVCSFTCLAKFAVNLTHQSLDFGLKHLILRYILSARHHNLN